MREAILTGMLALVPVAAVAQVVALDPAHGPPADQSTAMTREGRFARLLAGRIADSLAVRGIDAIVTTTDSTDPGTDARVTRAREAKATFLIALHSEAPNLLPPGVRGTILADTTDKEVRAYLGRVRPPLEQLLGGSLQLLPVTQLAALRRFQIPGLMFKLGNNADAVNIARLSTDPVLGALAGTIAQAVTVNVRASVVRPPTSP